MRLLPGLNDSHKDDILRCGVTRNMVLVLSQQFFHSVKITHTVQLLHYRTVVYANFLIPYQSILQSVKYGIITGS